MGDSEVGSILKVVVAVAIPLAAFITGLRAASTDGRWLFKHPGLLVRSLVTILVILPACTMLLLRLFDAPVATMAGVTIAVISIGIGPAAAFNKTRDKELSMPFEIGLNVVLLAVAIAFIPLFLSIHGAVFHHHVRLGYGQVAKVVLTRALIPLIIGIVAGRVFPRLVEPATKYGGKLVALSMLAVVAAALAATWRVLLGLGAKTWLICAVVVALEIAVSHAAGGPAPETRRTLASFGAIRFPALALLLASAAPRGREFIPVVLAYVIVSMAIVTLYGAATSRRRRAPGLRPRASRSDHLRPEARGPRSEAPTAVH
jgi:BASS family bile acid:Na+ symporter